MWQKFQKSIFHRPKSPPPEPVGLPPGFYAVGMAMELGVYLNKRPQIITDTLLDFPGSPHQSVIDEIEKFWGLEDRFKQRGLLHKRGILLHGAPGSGKTATMHRLIQIFAEKHNGVSIIAEGRVEGTIAGLKLLRDMEPNRPAICIMEDVDVVMKGQEETLLSLLDGEQQVNNIVFVATTNYPEKLSARLLDRPSRFDLIKEIGMPPAPLRREFLKRKEKTLTPGELEKWVSVSDGFSIAHLREMIVLCKCYDMSLDEAVDRLRKMKAFAAESLKKDGKQKKLSTDDDD